MRSTSKGLVVWDLTTDLYSHTQLAANWDLVDSYWVGFDAATKQVKNISTVAALPGSPAAGDICMLSAANGGFPAWTIVEYTGLAWRSIGPVEVQATVPVTNNYTGRVVLLSAATGGFDAWTLIVYNGSAYQAIGASASAVSIGLILALGG